MKQKIPSKVRTKIDLFQTRAASSWWSSSFSPSSGTFFCCSDLFFPVSRFLGTNVRFSPDHQDDDPRLHFFTFSSFILIMLFSKTSFRTFLLSSSSSFHAFLQSEQRVRERESRFLGSRRSFFTSMKKRSLMDDSMKQSHNILVSDSHGTQKVENDKKEKWRNDRKSNQILLSVYSILPSTLILLLLILTIKNRESVQF